VTLGWWIEMAVKVVLVFFVVLTGVAYISFAERRILAHIQSRIGPNRVGPQGLLQPAADALKLMTKETILPEAADKILFLFGPVFALVPAILAFSVIPFGESITLFGREIALHVTDVNVAVLFILALSSIGVYGIFLSAWASNNKYSLVGGLRSSAQMISYELTMGLVIVAVVMLSGSFSLVEIVHAQAKVPFILYQPIGFVLFMIGALAEINRTPFDLPEAETELVAGFHTEYSGMRFAIFALSEYANLMTVTSLATLMFLGGWLVPWPSLAWMAPIWFTLKVFVLIFFMMWTRGTLPRFRFDQLMLFGWKVLLPLALANIVITGLVLALLERS